MSLHLPNLDFCHVKDSNHFQLLFVAVSTIDAFPNVVVSVDDVDDKHVAKARSDVVDIPIVVGDELVRDDRSKIGFQN